MHTLFAQLPILLCLILRAEIRMNAINTCTEQLCMIYELKKYKQLYLQNSIKNIFIVILIEECRFQLLLRLRKKIQENRY